MLGMQSKHPPTSTGSGSIGRISNHMDGPVLCRTGRCPPKLCLWQSVTTPWGWGSGREKDPASTLEEEGFPLPLLLNQTASWELACRISCMYHLSGWSYRNDISVAGGSLGNSWPQLPAHGTPLCNLGVVVFVVVADVGLVGCGVWGGRFCFVFSTLPFLLSFVSLVTGQSTYEVQLSSSTP